MISGSGSGLVSLVIIILGQLNAKSPPGVANYFQYIPSTMTSA